MRCPSSTLFYHPYRFVYRLYDSLKALVKESGNCMKVLKMTPISPDKVPALR